TAAQSSSSRSHAGRSSATSGATSPSGTLSGRWSGRSDGAAERPLHEQPRRRGSVTEARVDPPHRGVALLVSRHELLEAGLLRPRDLRALERSRDSLAAPVPLDG